MKRLILLLALFLSFIFTSPSTAQTDSILVKPLKGSQCAFSLTVKNRNAAQTSIDEIKLEIVTADGTIWYLPTAPAQWGATLQPDNLTLSFTAEQNLLAAGTEKTGFIVDMDMTVSLSFDKPVSVKWTTLNGTQQVSTGFLTFICTPFQSGNIDSVTVQPSVVNNDPHFNFTVFNKNEAHYPISRFVVQLQGVGVGTMRPSKIAAPTGWIVDSVSAFYAYFSTTSSPISDNENLGGFQVALRGNPSVNKYTFNWFTYESGGALLGRDTIRNIPVTFSGSAAESDSLYASVVNGCLYSLTVKNYHVANTQLPSQIRKVVLWSKTPGLIFTAAQSAPTNWTKRVSAAGDSVIYTANHDSAALASSKVSSLFRFSVDPPTNDAFTIGWRTFRTLTDPLSTGEMQLQCSEQAPLQDVATIESVDECSWNIRITNQHNTPASSDLYAIDLSIPAGSGTLTTFASSLAWTKTNETATSVRYVAPAGAQQGSNSQQSILFSINPQTPGQPVVLTWKTYDEASLQSNTPLKADTFQLVCSPVVVLCDLVSAVTEPGPDTCMQNFTIKSQRTVALTGVTIEPRNGWKIDSVIAPAGWDAQLDANKTLVNFTNSTGIAPEGSQGDFRVMFAAIDQSDTFGVKITTADVSSRECDTTLTFTCTSGTSGAVNEIAFNPDQVSVVPNPVSQNATIELTIIDQSRIRITLLDVLGHQVADIANKMMQPGTYSIPLQMGGLSAGTYYVRVQSYYGVVTKKIVLTN